jgi:histidine triad (HIT) family protein
MVADCLFCKIVAGEIPAKRAHETGHSFAFHDINPQAPTHVLVVPKEHIATANELHDVHGEILADMFQAAQRVAAAQGIDKTGYRLVFNVGDDAGMEVHHLHLHVLGGRKMAWPPG